MQVLQHTASILARVRGLTDRHYAHERVISGGILAREAHTLLLQVVLAHAGPPAGGEESVTLSASHSIEMSALRVRSEAYQLRSAVAIFSC